MRRAAICLTASLVSFAAAATELEDGTFLFDADSPLPSDVLALEECGAEEDPFATRQPFAGGFVFTIRCPGNNANYMQTLIFAEDEEGKGAGLLRFPQPSERGGGTQDTISNIRWYPDKNEIGEIYVNPEVEEDPDPICRTEGRWRLKGHPPKPKLVFWRQNSRLRWQEGVEGHPRQERRLREVRGAPASVEADTPERKQELLASRAGSLMRYGYWHPAMLVMALWAFRIEP